MEQNIKYLSRENSFLIYSSRYCVKGKCWIYDMRDLTSKSFIFYFYCSLYRHYTIAGFFALLPNNFIRSCHTLSVALTVIASFGDICGEQSYRYNVNRFMNTWHTIHILQRQEHRYALRRNILQWKLHRCYSFQMVNR